MRIGWNLNSRRLRSAALILKRPTLRPKQWRAGFPGSGSHLPIRHLHFHRMRVRVLKYPVHAQTPQCRRIQNRLANRHNPTGAGNREQGTGNRREDKRRFPEPTQPDPTRQPLPSAQAAIKQPSMKVAENTSMFSSPFLLRVLRVLRDSTSSLLLPVSPVFPVVSPCSDRQANQVQDAKERKPVAERGYTAFCPSASAWYERHTPDLIERQFVQNAAPAVEKAGHACCRRADGFTAVFNGAQDDGGKVLLHRGAGLEP